MCGRYVAKWNAAQFEQTFNVQPPLFESYNVAPTQYAPIVRRADDAREVLEARWGLIPRWVDKPADFRANLFNARAETVAEKPSFKRAFKTQRCLIPATGFYEWQALEGGKQPHYIHPEDGGLLAFAGLWDHWQGDEDALTSYTILTTTPNDVMRPLHNRMPVILPKETFEVWLDPESDTDMLEHLLKPYEGGLEHHQVDKRVGKVRENDEGLIAASS